jgi:hypothetical protein
MALLAFGNPGVGDMAFPSRMVAGLRAALEIKEEEVD